MHLQASAINNKPIGWCHKGSFPVSHSRAHTAHTWTRTHTRERARSSPRGGSGCSGSCWKPGWDNHACLAPGVDAAAVAGSGLDSGRGVGLVPDWSYLDLMSSFSSIPRETRAMVARGVNAVLWKESCVFANGGENSFCSDAQPRFGITWRREKAPLRGYKGNTVI